MEQQLVNGLVLAGIYVMFSLGLSLSWGTLDVLNMAHGATFMFSGFVAYYVSQHADAPFALVAVFGVLLFRMYAERQYFSTAISQEYADRGTILVQVVGWGTGLVCTAAGAAIFHSRVKP